MSCFSVLDFIVYGNDSDNSFVFNRLVVAELYAHERQAISVCSCIVVTRIHGIVLLNHFFFICLFIYCVVLLFIYSLSILLILFAW